MNLDRRTKTFERLVIQRYQTGSNITQDGRWSSRGSLVLPRSPTSASPRGRVDYFSPLTVLQTSHSCSSSSVLDMSRVSRDGLLRDRTRRAVADDRRPYLTRVLDKLEDLVDELNWLHLAYKAVAYSYLAFVLWLISFILPFPSNWSRLQQSDRVPIVYQDLKKCVCSETATLGNRN